MSKSKNAGDFRTPTTILPTLVLKPLPEFAPKSGRPAAPAGQFREPTTILPRLVLKPEEGYGTSSAPFVPIEQLVQSPGKLQRFALEPEQQEARPVLLLQFQLNAQVPGLTATLAIQKLEEALQQAYRDRFGAELERDSARPVAALAPGWLELAYVDRQTRDLEVVRQQLGSLALLLDVSLPTEVLQFHSAIAG